MPAGPNLQKLPTSQGFLIRKTRPKAGHNALLPAVVHIALDTCTSIGPDCSVLLHFNADRYFMIIGCTLQTKQVDFNI